MHYKIHHKMDKNILFSAMHRLQKVDMIVFEKLAFRK